MDNDNKIRVILSTNGPLHLIKTAEFLCPIVDIKVIQGWIPSWWNKWLLSIASKIQRRDIYKTIKKRTPTSLEGRNIGLAIPDMFYWACRLFKLTTHQNASTYSAILFGKQQKHLLHDADIYHVRSGSGANGAIKVAKQRGMKVLIDHSIAHPAYMDKHLKGEYERNKVEFTTGMDNSFWREIVEECKQGDAILVNSYFVRDTFVEQGFDPCKIKVVYLGVRQDFQFLKQNYQLKNDCVRILFTGGFNFRKGAEYILQSLCELDKEGFSYEMTVVGDYREAKPLIDRYAPKHLTLVYTVPQDELKTYLANSDVYLFPSLCEGCASSGMEALAAGLPVIATHESGFPITDGQNGIIIPTKDVDAIVREIKRVAANLQLRETLGQNGAKLIAENYTWEQYAENVVEVYKELLV